MDRRPRRCGFAAWVEAGADAANLRFVGVDDEEQVNAFQMGRLHVGDMLQLHAVGLLGSDGGSYCLRVAKQ
jgi:hypothetical protein